MRILGLTLIAIALTAEAPPPFDPAPFDRAIATSNFNEAAAIIDELIEKRIPADGQPRQDALLNSLIGRLFLSSQQEAAAASFLERSKVDELPPALRVPTLLARGKSLELLGRRAEALQAYHDAATASADNTTAKRDALLGAARQLIVTDPAEARRLITPLATTRDPASRWEALNLLAIAASLTGDRSSAADLAQRAWNDAAAANPADLAPTRVAVVRAGLAAQSKDKQSEIAMLVAANAMGVGRDSDLSGELPVCGDDGLRPDDFVTFGIVIGPYNSNWLIPVAASRAAAVRPFYDRLAGRQLITRSNDSSTNGTVVTLSCRSSVSPDYGSPPPAPDPLLDWFTERGLYPATMKLAADDKTINLISTKVDGLEARFGKQSPLLLEPRWQLLTLLQVQAVTGGDVAPGRLMELRSSIAAGLRQAGAPEWLAQALEFQNDIQAMGNASPSASSFIALTQKQLALMPFEQSRAFAQRLLENVQGDLPAPMAQLIVGLDSKTPKDLPLRQRQAWLLTLARAERALGRDKDVEATLRSTKLESDLCDAATKDPKLLEENFSSDDYPTELIPADQDGFTLFEFGLSRTGQVQQPRVVVSIPSGLFDEIALKGVLKIRYTPAAQSSRDIACRGELQGVAWRLQQPNGFGLPPLIPKPSGDRT